MSDTKVTRRRLLEGAAIAGAGAALPAGAQAATRHRAARSPSARRADVVVVGAGLAGLTAARKLAAHGRSVLVLEARGRVGGRTLNHHLPHGKVIEVGGQWIGPTQDRIAALARSLGVRTFKTYDHGDYLYHREGSQKRYPSHGPLGPVPPDPDGVGDALKAITELDSMAQTVPLDAPYKARNAREWDSQTFETWKLANLSTPGGRFILDLATNAVFACEPRDVSLLHVLFYIHSAGNARKPGSLITLTSTSGGSQESRFHGGSQLVSIRAAQRLGRRVILNAPVRRIVQSGRGVTVHADGVTVEAQAVIVTGPPAVTAQIDYDPILPPDRAQLLQRFPQGSVIKCQAVYRKPFWRDVGLAGQVTSDLEPVGVTFDNSPPGGPGVMLGFIEGEAARTWGFRSEPARRRAVLENFATYFGSQARRPIDYVEMNWSREQWTRGCYGGFLPPGVLTDYGAAIRRPHHRVHWAGTETATVWNGYMDGAVSSGERAAGEVLARLGRQPRRVPAHGLG